MGQDSLNNDDLFKARSASNFGAKNLGHSPYGQPLEQLKAPKLLRKNNGHGRCGHRASRVYHGAKKQNLETLSSLRIGITTHRTNATAACPTTAARAHRTATAFAAG